jgi:hypothetical protein
MRVEEAREAIVQSLPNLSETDVFAVMRLLQVLNETSAKEVISPSLADRSDSSRSDELPSFWERLMEFRQGLEDTDLNPDEVWGDVRDRTPMPIEPQFP